MADGQRSLNHREEGRGRPSTDHASVAAAHRLVLQHLPNGAAFLVDRQGRVVCGGGPVSPSFLRADVGRQGLEGEPFAEALADGDRETLLGLMRDAFAGLAARREVTRGPRVFEITAMPVAADEGQATAALLFCNDVTETRRTLLALAAEQRLLETALAERQRADGEKAVLLKEIHHRVKNNLQIISSLLNFEARNVNDPGALDMLRETQTRVRSIALIHEKLYESGLAGVEMGTYARSLVTILTQALGTSAHGVRIGVRSEGVVLDVDTAVPCGLILNELVTNAVKHAFPESVTGPAAPSIIVEMRTQAPGACILAVTDNGVGLPAELELTRSTTLGMQLLKMLARHIEGTVRIAREGGTRIEVDFPMRGPPGQVAG